MTAENNQVPPTAAELLGRLPDVPHIGSYGNKDHFDIQPFVKGNEVDPDKVGEKGKREEKKEEKGKT